MARLGRRDVAIGLGLASIATAWQVWGVSAPKLRFEPIAGAPGWSFALSGGMSGVSGGDWMTVGLEKGPSPVPASQLHQTLYRDTLDGVRVAVFSDFFCPYCRELVARLKLRKTGPKLAVNWHELPLLGPNSVMAAKSAEAASLQGGYTAFYTQLRQDGFRPGKRWLSGVAHAAGLDGARLVRDMDGPEVAARLESSAAAAARIGFFATPGIVIGRKAVLGALDGETMDAMVQEALLLA